MSIIYVIVAEVFRIAFVSYKWEIWMCFSLLEILGIGIAMLLNTIWRFLLQIYR